MKTPRKKITLKTPKRTSKEMFKAVKKEDSKQDVSSQERITDYNNLDAESSKVLKELEEYENKLLKKYKKEVEYLRSVKTDTHLYKKLLGLDIKDNNGELVINYEVDEEGKKFINFMLIPNDSMYNYRLIKFNNVDLPDVFKEEICFEKSQIIKFFFKVMEIMISN